MSNDFHCSLCGCSAQDHNNREIGGCTGCGECDGFYAHADVDVASLLDESRNTPTPERVDIAREARALARDNAQDAIERVIRDQVPGVSHEQAWPLADAIITELAAWFRQRPPSGQTVQVNTSEWAARLLEEFTP